jgi:hypothetical protein
MNTESIFESFYSSGANIILKYNANTEHSRWFVFIIKFFNYEQNVFLLIRLYSPWFCYLLPFAPEPLHQRFDFC